MKIRVDQLVANPFRHIEKYPLRPDKVRALKNSIDQTGFWDNILARPKPGENGVFEIAYGHHRMAAVRETDITEVDIPVRNLDDATMLRIMANENMDDWRTAPAIINATVLTVKEFIDGELKKYTSWESAMANETISHLFDGAKAFSNAKREEGVGQITILKFLGDNWKQWIIQEALATLNDDKEGKVDRAAVEVFNTTEQAKAFRTAVKDYNLPKSEQKKVAQEIVAGEQDSKRKIKKAIQNVVARETVKKAKTETEAQTIKQDIEMKRLGEAVKAAISSINRASSDIQAVLDRLEELKVENVSGIDALTLRNAASTLDSAMQRLKPVVGLEENEDE